MERSILIEHCCKNDFIQLRMIICVHILTDKYNKKPNTADIQFDCKILPTATEIKLTSVFFDEDAVC
jgi:hypothetical protein